METLCIALMGRFSTQSVSTFGWIYPTSFWCGIVYVIMATRIPTPQSVIVGTKRHY